MGLFCFGSSWLTKRPLSPPPRYYLQLPYAFTSPVWAHGHRSWQAMVARSGLRLEEQRPGNQGTECPDVPCEDAPGAWCPGEEGQAAGEGRGRSVPALCVLSREGKQHSVSRKAGHRSPRPKRHRSGGPSEKHENRGTAGSSWPAARSRELRVPKRVGAKPFKTPEADSEPTAESPPCS